MGDARNHGEHTPASFLSIRSLVRPLWMFMWDSLCNFPPHSLAGLESISAMQMLIPATARPLCIRLPQARLAPELAIFRGRRVESTDSADLYEPNDTHFCEAQAEIQRKLEQKVTFWLFMGLNMDRHRKEMLDSSDAEKNSLQSVVRKIF